MMMMIYDDGSATKIERMMKRKAVSYGFVGN
jgi:hypothetical protein